MIDEQLRGELFKLISNAASKIDRVHYGQEPNYTAAFFGKLHGETITNMNGQYIKFEFSVSDDRGPKSAEHETGIDIGMVFEWGNKDREIFKKAIIMQAKNNLRNLSPSQKIELNQQCATMARITDAAIVMDCPYDGSVPNIYESKSNTEPWNSSAIQLSKYIADYVLTCLRGDTREEIIDIARRADRGRLKVSTNMPKPTPNPQSNSRPPKLGM